MRCSARTGKDLSLSEDIGVDGIALGKRMEQRREVTIDPKAVPPSQS